jgi:hypothetical protein
MRVYDPATGKGESAGLEGGWMTTDEIERSLRCSVEDTIFFDEV